MKKNRHFGGKRKHLDTLRAPPSDEDASSVAAARLYVWEGAACVCVCVCAGLEACPTAASVLASTVLSTCRANYMYYHMYTRLFVVYSYIVVYMYFDIYTRFCVLHSYIVDHMYYDICTRLYYSVSCIGI